MEIRILQEQELEIAAGLSRYVFDVCVRNRMEFEQSIAYIEDYLTAENLRKLYTQETITLWGAFEQGQMVAVSALQADGMITMLYVLPVHVNKGIGSALLRTVRRYAGEKLGLERVILNATPAWMAGYFARQGFRYAEKSQRARVPYVPMYALSKDIAFSVRRHVPGKVIALAVAGCFAFATVATVLFFLLY